MGHMEENEYEFFVDMDEVLVDFVAGYEELTGIDISGTFRNDEKFWDPINKAGYKFWLNLDWRPDGKELWDYVKKYKPTILSAPSKENASRVGKHDWVKRELPGVRLVLRSAEHKKDFAKRNHVIIDDRKEIIDSWIAAGGIGIQHKNTKDTIAQLKKLNL